jgi:4-amino-4-deoxy-L-arabinose transferase-like glycosyltransferase
MTRHDLARGWRSRLWQEGLVLVALTALALGLRLYLLARIPFGLHGDEAADGLDVVDVLVRHQFPVFFARNTGREPLFMYLQAGSAALIGATPFALRLVAALAGAATIPAIYWMVREAFHDTAHDARWLAFWTACFMAVAYWHITFSRLSFRVILLPFIAAIALAWFWRAWRQLATGARLPWRPLILCGLCTGLSLYTYISSRLLPVLLVVIIACDALAHRHSPPYLRRAALGLAVIGGAALIVFLPLLTYFLQHPQAFIGHALEVSVVEPGGGSHSLVPSTLAGILDTAKMFVVAGDPDRRHNPAACPLFDPALALWLAAGLGLGVAKWRSLPRLASVAWLALFALPVALTPDGSPNSLRGLAMIPAAYLLPVLAMSDVRVMLEKRMATGGTRRLAAFLLPLPFFLFSGVTGVRDYFTAWQTDTATLQQAFDVSIIRAAGVLSEIGTPDDVWVLPVSKAGLSSDYTLEFSYKGLARFGMVAPDETSTPAQLNRLAADHHYAFVPDWARVKFTLDGYYPYADPKHFLNFLLRKHGRQVASQDSAEIPYTTYELPATPDYRVANALTPAGASFGGKVRLTGVAFGRTARNRTETAAALDEQSLPAGDAAWVVLRWQAEAQIDHDLKVSLRLTDENGHLAGQVDDLLVSDGYPFSGVWQAGEAASTYHILPTLPGILPDRYQLQAVVYDGKTGEVYPVMDTDGTVARAGSAVLGFLEVTAPVEPQVVQPSNPLPNATCFGDELCLTGYDLAGRVVDAGTSLRLTLYWQALRKPTSDYQMSVALQDAQGHVVASGAASLGGAHYPATQWQAGDWFRAWFDLPIVPDTPSATYRLTVGLKPDAGRATQADLGSITVSARSHRFTAPVIRHPQKVNLGSSIAFLGYEPGSGTIKPGEPFGLTLYWQARAPVAQSYKVFVHLLGSAGNIVAQVDYYPGDGSLPTSGWLAGEYVTDSRQVPLGRDVPPGDYRVEIGMYDESTGTRLPVFDQDGNPLGDRILLTEPLRVLP